MQVKRAHISRGPCAGYSLEAGGSTSTYRKEMEGGRRSIKLCTTALESKPSSGKRSLAANKLTRRWSTLSMHQRSVLRLSNSSGMTFERVLARSDAVIRVSDRTCLCECRNSEAHVDRSVNSEGLETAKARLKENKGAHQ